MDEKRFRVELLGAQHKRLRATFQSSSPELNRYLREQARQDMARSAATVWILLDRERAAIAGYYTLSAAEVALGDLPNEVVARLPRYPALPAALIGRLAISQDYQGQGLGGVLLVDALRRAASVRTTIGVVTVVVDAKDEAAARFYEHYGFLRLHDTLGRLFIPIADVP